MRHAARRSRDLLQRLGKAREIWQLARRLHATRSGITLLPQAVHPYRRQLELVRRRDVVEESRGEVRVARLPHLLLEGAPVPERRFVRADFRGDDRELEGHAEL